MIRLGQSSDNSPWIGLISCSVFVSFIQLVEGKTDLFDDFGMTTNSRDGVCSLFKGLYVRGVGVMIDRIIKPKFLVEIDFDIILVSSLPISDCSII